MEVGTEISQKIRSAIKAKLMEIGSYVDDELPDYIMVMVANKKTQLQMSNDLSLFLGANTDVFTTWLHGLLNKLQTVSSDSGKAEKSKVAKDKKRDKDKKSKESTGGESKKEKRKITKKSGDSDAPKAKSSRTVSADKTDSTDIQEKSQSVSESENSSNIKDGKLQQTDKKHNKNVDTKSDDVEDVRQLLVQTPADELAEELETTEARIEKLSSSSKSAVKDIAVAEDRERISSTREADLEAAPSSKKRKCPSSVVTIRRDEEDTHSSPVVASVVKVTSRKSSFPQSMQANSETLSHAKEKGSEETVNLNTCSTDDHVSLNFVKQALSEVLTQWQDKEDDIRIFCKNIEKTLRKMSLGDFAITKLKFQKILFDYEMSQHRQASSLKNSQPQKELLNPPNLSDSSKQTSKETTVTSNLCTSESVGLNLPSTSSLNLSSASASQDHLKLKNSDKHDISPKDSGASSLQMDSTKINEGSEGTGPRRIIFGLKQKEGRNGHSLKQSSSNPECCSNEVQLVSTAVSSTVSESSGLDSPSSIHHGKADQVKLSSSSLSSSNSRMCHPSRDSLPRTQNSSLHPTILISSLHQKRRHAPGSPSVLRNSLSHDPPTSKVAQGASSEVVPDSSKEISPEQLKVLAKNLKITVVNKRALRSEDKSNSDNSSSDDSEEESESEDEESDEELQENRREKPREPANDKL